MTKHELPSVLKEKIKAEAEVIAKLDAEIKAIDQRLKDLLSAYILGAGLPQQNIRFDDEFNLLFESTAPASAAAPTAAPTATSPSSAPIQEFAPVGSDTGGFQTEMYSTPKPEWNM